MRILVDYDDKDVTRMLQRLIDAGINPRQALGEIGLELKESTKKRFESQSGPDGTPWAPNSEVTIARKGEKPPLTNVGTLMDQINYQLSGNDTLEVGSPTIYAAMQQFGGTKSAFPHLWGDIPARPFLGVSDEDEAMIIDIFNSYLADQVS